MNRLSVTLGFGLIAIMLSMTLAPTVWAEEAAQAKKIVEKASKSLKHLAADPNMTWFRDNLKRAKAVLLVPEQIKAGFIFGGSGGSGVLLARNDQGVWSQPAFYGMGSGSVGFQIGAQVAEVALLFMTPSGLNALLGAKVQLGGDISVATGPVGAGAQAATTDVLAFARTKGLYGGISVEGAVIGPRHKLNNAYYGKTVSPYDILIKREVTNNHAAGLVTAMTKTAQP